MLGLSLEHFALAPHGPRISLEVAAGRALAVVGPGASGKSRLLRIALGKERAPFGALRSLPPVPMPILTRRSRPQAVARRLADAGRSAAALTRLGLWEHRNLTRSDMSPSQAAALEVLPLLLGPSGLIVLDGLLDALDPVALAGAWEMLEERLRAGDAVVLATHRPDLVERCDAAMVLRDGEILFGGTVAELRRRGPAPTVLVETQRQPGVRALVAPFEVRLTETEHGVLMEAPEGQELAARLLGQGYGDVRAVLVRAPSVAEAINAILGR